jgi:hypothetical protein
MRETVACANGLRFRLVLRDKRQNHRYESRDRAGVHLSQDVRLTKLDGSYADAQFPGNPLIGLARDDRLEQRTLVVGKRVKASVSILFGCGDLTAISVKFDRLADRLLNSRGTARFL